MTRYIIGFIVTIGLVIVLILLLVGGGSNNAKKPSTSRTLYSYANTDAQARLTIDGPINADQNHQQVQITVEQSDVTFDQLQGYDGQVVNQQAFPNTQNGYNAFLHSLALAGFTKGNTDSTLKDESGYCPLGDRYIFEFTQDGQDLERYWATSCGGTKTYQGNLALTINLFEAQVPNYSTLVQNIQF